MVHEEEGRGESLLLFGEKVLLYINRKHRNVVSHKSPHSAAFSSENSSTESIFTSPMKFDSITTSDVNKSDFFTKASNTSLAN